MLCALEGLSEKDITYALMALIIGLGLILVCMYIFNSKTIKYCVPKYLR